MAEREIDISMQEGSSDAVLHSPEGDGNWPGVLYLTDIGGIRASNRESASRLSKQGYTVLMPNIFFRTGHAPLQPSLRTLDAEAMKKRMAELSTPLTPEVMRRDVSTYIDFLSSQECTRKGTIGVAGYCFSGKMAMYAAAERSDKVAAAASFHGGGLFTNAPASPHLVLPRIKARLYFAHATKDRSMPEEAIQKFEQALRSWGGKYENETYADAYHSWTSSDSPVYNEPQAERALGKLLELFEKTLQAALAA